MLREISNFWHKFIHRLIIAQPLPIQTIGRVLKRVTNLVLAYLKINMPKKLLILLTHAQTPRSHVQGTLSSPVFNILAQKWP